MNRTKTPDTAAYGPYPNPFHYFPIPDPFAYRIASVDAEIGGVTVSVALSDSSAANEPFFPLMCDHKHIDKETDDWIQCEDEATYVQVTDTDGAIGVQCKRHGPDDTLCIDCGVDTFPGEFYMVRDDVWPIGYADGMLCIGCLEVRIGRQLTHDDFTEYSISEGNPGNSARYNDRLSLRHKEGGR